MYIRIPWQRASELALHFLTEKRDEYIRKANLWECCPDLGLTCPQVIKLPVAVYMVHVASWRLLALSTELHLCGISGLIHLCGISAPGIAYLSASASYAWLIVLHGRRPAWRSSTTLKACFLIDQARRLLCTSVSDRDIYAPGKA